MVVNGLEDGEAVVPVDTSFRSAVSTATDATSHASNARDAWRRSSSKSRGASILGSMVGLRTGSRDSSFSRKPRKASTERSLVCKNELIGRAQLADLLRALEARLQRRLDKVNDLRCHRSYLSAVEQRLVSAQLKALDIEVAQLRAQIARAKSTNLDLQPCFCRVDMGSLQRHAIELANQDKSIAARTLWQQAGKLVHRIESLRGFLQTPSPVASADSSGVAAALATAGTARAAARRVRSPSKGALEEHEAQHTLQLHTRRPAAVTFSPPPARHSEAESEGRTSRVSPSPRRTREAPPREQPSMGRRPTLVDTNGDGVLDGVGIDTNCDGQIDLRTRPHIVRLRLRAARCTRTGGVSARVSSSDDANASHAIAELKATDQVSAMMSRDPGRISAHVQRAVAAGATASLSQRLSRLSALDEMAAEMQVRGRMQSEISSAALEPGQHRRS